MATTEEMKTALTIAEAMAGRLTTLPGVIAIHLAPLPNFLTARPLDPSYRLLVVVDDPTASAYRERLANPLSSYEMDGAGAQITGSGEVVDAHTFYSERKETSTETLFDLLDTTQDGVFPNSIWNSKEYDEKWALALADRTVLDMLEEIGLVLVPADWYNDIEPYTSLKRTYTDDDGSDPETYPVYNAAEWFYAALNYQVYDSSMGTFSNR